MSIREWLSSLADFEYREIWLTSLMGHRVSALGKKPLPGYAIAYLGGGTIGGVCRKAGYLAGSGNGVENIIRCPTCLEHGLEERLIHGEDEMSCQECGTSYPRKGGVLFLLPKEEMCSLYPMLHT